MTNPEHFMLSPEDPKLAENSWNIAMVAIFGPAITGEATMRHDKNTADEQALIEAVHSAISSIIVREFPEAVAKHGLSEAINEFNDNYGMRGGFPAPTNNPCYERDYPKIRAEAIIENRTRRLEAMANSRYTITLGQAIRILLPYIEAFDDTAKDMFDEISPHRPSRAFQGIWRQLSEQDTHVKHPSRIMEWLYDGLDQPYRELPPQPDDPLRDYLNQGFVMTEADIRLIFSEPIANAFQQNIHTIGTLKPEFTNPQDALM